MLKLFFFKKIATLTFSSTISQIKRNKMSVPPLVPPAVPKHAHRIVQLTKRERELRDRWGGMQHTATAKARGAAGAP